MQILGTSTIRAKLVALVLACAIPPSLLGAAWIAYDYQENKRQAALESIGRARAMMSAVDYELAGIEAALTSLSTSPHLKSGDLRAFHAQAAELAERLGINNVVLIDAQFHQRVNTIRPYGAELPMEGNAQLRAVFGTGASVVSNVFSGAVLQKPLVAVAVPVRPGGKVEYVLAAGVWPERLSRLLSRQQLQPDWIGTILDGEGIIVARTHQMDRFVGTSGSAALVARIKEVREDSLETRTLEGIPVISAFSRSAVSNWTVALGIPSAGFVADFWQALGWLLAAIVICAALSLTLALRIGGTIARSIRGLTEIATRVNQGQLVEVTPTLGLREADEVGRALMTAMESWLAAEHESHHDALTGLANRVLFRAVAEQQLSVSRRNAAPLAILYVDLDGFKRVNDRHGHRTGDELLREAGTRLSAALRQSDLAARLGGDEFAAMLVSADAAAARSKATSIVDALSRPYLIDGHTLQISASVGVAVFPGDGETADELLTRADEAMYRAKAAGKKGVAMTLARR